MISIVKNLELLKSLLIQILRQTDFIMTWLYSSWTSQSISMSTYLQEYYILSKKMLQDHLILLLMFISNFRYIQPICLPNAGMSSRTFIGERPVALGWGSTHYGGAEVGTLRGVDLPVWSQTECDAAYFQVNNHKLDSTYFILETVFFHSCWYCSIMYLFFISADNWGIFVCRLS